MTTSTGAALRRIVVGVDGSEHSEYALRWARRLAGSETLTEAVTVWDYPQNYSVVPWGLEAWHPNEDAAKVLEETIDRVFGADRPRHLDTVVDQGQPAAVLVERSRGADLLIVGGRGHGGFAGLLLGSVSDRCVEHAPCAVLVAHQPPPED